MKKILAKKITDSLSNHIHIISESGQEDYETGKLSESIPALESYSAQVKLFGDVRGIMIITMDKPLAEFIGFNIFGFDLTENDDPDIYYDCVKEFINILTAHAQSMLHKEGIDFDVFLPEDFSASDFSEYPGYSFDEFIFDTGSGKIKTIYLFEED